ncbi:TPA: winged helix-turn-helix domain-containing protein [Serratia marcescens]|nr:winged helix-turn-helix domain-containing protein [Serratia marcescens]
MIFHINNNVLYDEDENTLSHIDNAATKIVLLRPSARLLSLFIRNNNVLLMRESLLNDVWVEHGLKASNNNLNNYVSGLRKSLAQFGEEALIVTYPRQGFKFTADIIHEVNNNEEVKKPENNPEGDNEVSKLTNKEVLHNGTNSPFRRLLLAFLACLVPFAAIVLYQNATRISMYPLGDYDRCQIYSMNSGSGHLSEIKRFIQRAGFNCRSKADVYYYDNIRDEASQKGKELLTFCPREKSSPCIYNYIDKE